MPTNPEIVDGAGPDRLSPYVALRSGRGVMLQRLCLKTRRTLRRDTGKRRGINLEDGL